MFPIFKFPYLNPRRKISRILKWKTKHLTTNKAIFTLSFTTKSVGVQRRGEIPPIIRIKVKREKHSGFTQVTELVGEDAKSANEL